MQNEHEQLIALEALLFVASKPLSEKEIYAHLASHFPDLEVSEVIKALQNLYVQQNRAFRIGYVSGGYLLETKAEVAPYISSFVTPRKSRLSKGALEVLSIIAYKQPITRPEIDAIRGIDSGPHVETLLEGEWIVSKGKKEVPGRPTLFGTTEKFLLHFNLPSIEKLIEHSTV